MSFRQKLAKYKAMASKQDIIIPDLIQYVAERSGYIIPMNRITLIQVEDNRIIVVTTEYEITIMENDVQVKQR